MIHGTEPQNVSLSMNLVAADVSPLILHWRSLSRLTSAATSQSGFMVPMHVQKAIGRSPRLLWALQPTTKPTHENPEITSHPCGLRRDGRLRNQALHFKLRLSRPATRPAARARRILRPRL